MKTSIRTAELSAIADRILSLNMLEVVELQKVLAERTGVDLKQMQSARVAAAAPAAGKKEKEAKSKKRKREKENDD